MSPKTTARRLTSLRGFARWAKWEPVLEEYIAPTPSKTVAHPLSEGVEGIRAMIAEAKNHEQAALVAFGGLAGCRISESLSMSVKSFDLHSMVLTVRGKGDKTRVIPLSDEAWSALSMSYAEAMMRPDQTIVRYKDRFARQVITNLAARAGIKRPVSSHDLRATFATAALDAAKGNVRVVQEILGHASVETTEIYTGVELANMRKAVNF